MVVVIRRRSLWWCPGPEVHRTGTGTESRGAQCNAMDRKEIENFFSEQMLISYRTFGGLGQWGALKWCARGEGAWVAVQG